MGRVINGFEDHETNVAILHAMGLQTIDGGVYTASGLPVYLPAKAPDQERHVALEVHHCWATET